MADPFFKELASVEPTDDLYRMWQEYALSLSRDDILKIIRLGLTHQANSLKSMIKEIIGGSRAPDILHQKMDLVASATARRANRIRAS